MNKMLFVGIVFVVFIIGFAAGMVSEFFLIDNNKNNGSSNYINEFIGTWKALEYSQNESSDNGTIHYTWSFYGNQTVHLMVIAVNETINKTVADEWHPFEISENTLEIISPTGFVVDYSFSFSEDKKELILTRDGASLTFYKE